MAKTPKALSSVSVTGPIPFNQLTKPQRHLLQKAWDWLVDHDCPWDVKTNSRYHFAVVDGHPVALAEIRDFPPIAADTNWTWIQVLFASPHHRKLGYGKLLMEHVITHYARPGSQIGLGTQQNNEAMHHLSKSVGMEQRYDFWLTYPPEGTEE